MTKKPYIIGAAIILSALFGAGLYSWHLSGKISQRFSSRRWSIPSTVFADTMLLYPGQRLDVTLLREKLKRVGYREVSGQPARKGEIQITPDGVDIFLHDLETPWKKRAGFLATIEFSQNSIASMTRRDDGMEFNSLAKDYLKNDADWTNRVSQQEYRIEGLSK